MYMYLYRALFVIGTISGAVRATHLLVLLLLLLFLILLLFFFLHFFFGRCCRIGCSRGAPRRASTDAVLAAKTLSRLSLPPTCMSYCPSQIMGADECGGAGPRAGLPASRPRATAESNAEGGAAENKNKNLVFAAP